MKKITLFLGIVFGTSILTSCGGETAEEQTQQCNFSYNANNSVIEWTSFKFTERKGVKGSFNDYLIDGVSSAPTAKELVESLAFTIQTNSVETNDPGRNEKIANFFFGTLETPVLSGKVNKLMDDGKAEIEISMHGITKKVMGTYKLDDIYFSFNASIDVLDWDGATGIDALNAQCIDNHTGPDGVLKLWSEVDLSFTTTLDKTCKN